MKNLKIITVLIMGLCLFSQDSFAQGIQEDYLTKKTVSGKSKKYYEKGMAYNTKGDNAKA